MLPLLLMAGPQCLMPARPAREGSGEMGTEDLTGSSFLPRREGCRVGGVRLTEAQGLQLAPLLATVMAGRG